jgi:hypothetical protein
MTDDAMAERDIGRFVMEWIRRPHGPRGVFQVLTATDCYLVTVERDAQPMIQVVVRP